MRVQMRWGPWLGGPHTKIFFSLREIRELEYSSLFDFLVVPHTAGKQKKKAEIKNVGREVKASSILPLISTWRKHINSPLPLSSFLG